MRWSPQPSPEPAPDGGGLDAPGFPSEAATTELRLMRRRFVEALRRAEIVSLVAEAVNEEGLGRSVAEELCEVYDAEIAFVVDGGDRAPRTLAAVGVATEDAARLGEQPLVGQSLSSPGPLAARGKELLGAGGRAALLASFRGSEGRHVVAGVVRLYDQGFDEAETALLEAVTESAGRALERLWAQADRDRLIGELKDALVGTAEAMAAALEAKDDYTADHARQIADLAVAVGTRLGMAEPELEDLRYGAIFHDIGKIAIPDSILQKPGPLDAAERAVIESHPATGERILAPIPFLSDRVREIVRHNHERWDGGGYPDGLSGTDIPLGARIVLAVDAYHAMITDRPYREALTLAEACRELGAGAGSQFDPGVIDAFLDLIADRHGRRTPGDNPR